MTCQLEILLSTYNGERYLTEQLDSLLSQSFIDWHLLIRDDGSSDNTRQIIDAYIKAHPNKITLLEDGLANLGASQSFSMLLSQSCAPYVALCDQDDRWNSDKLAIQMASMHEHEAARDKTSPLLITTDLVVADAELKVLAPSLWLYQNLNPGKLNAFNYLLVQNHNTGCTFLFNRALVKRILPIAENAVMHDWWIALIAAARGEIITISQATVLYRQHAHNEIGAKKWGVFFIVKNILQASKICRASIKLTRQQASALLSSGLIDDKIDDQNTLLLKKYLTMFERGWIERRKIMWQEKFYKQGWLRNLAMFLYI